MRALLALGRLLHRLRHLLRGLRHLTGCRLAVRLRLHLLHHLLHLLLLRFSRAIPVIHLLHHLLDLLLNLLLRLLIAGCSLLHLLGHVLRLLLVHSQLLLQLLGDLLLLLLRISRRLLKLLGQLLHLLGRLLLLLLVHLVELFHRLIELIKCLGEFALRDLALRVGDRPFLILRRGDVLCQILHRVLRFGELGIVLRLALDRFLRILQRLERRSPRGGGVLNRLLEEILQIDLRLLDGFVVGDGLGNGFDGRECLLDLLGGLGALRFHEFLFLDRRFVTEQIQLRHAEERQHCSKHRAAHADDGARRLNREMLVVIDDDFLRRLLGILHRGDREGIGAVADEKCGADLFVKP
jgi:hypothetical protein